MSRLAVSLGVAAALLGPVAGQAMALPVSVDTVRSANPSPITPGRSLPLTGIEAPAATAAGVLLISVGMLLEVKQRSYGSNGKAAL